MKRPLAALFAVLALWLALSVPAAAAPASTAAIPDGDCALGGSAAWTASAGLVVPVTPVSSDGHPACQAQVTAETTGSDWLAGYGTFSDLPQYGDVLTIPYYLKVSGASTPRRVFIYLGGLGEVSGVPDCPGYVVDIPAVSEPATFEGVVSCTFQMTVSAPYSLIVAVQNVNDPYLVDAGETLTWALSVCRNDTSCALPYCNPPKPNKACKGKSR